MEASSQDLPAHILIKWAHKDYHRCVIIPLLIHFVFIPAKEHVNAKVQLCLLGAHHSMCSWWKYTSTRPPSNSWFGGPSVQFKSSNSEFGGLISKLLKHISSLFSLNINIFLASLYLAFSINFIWYLFFLCILCLLKL